MIYAAKKIDRRKAQRKAIQEPSRQIQRNVQRVVRNLIIFLDYSATHQLEAVEIKGLLFDGF
jgi:hypothetical protein